MIIYDTNSLVHKGNGAKFSQNFSYNGLKTGGLYLFFMNFISDLKKGEYLVLPMDSPIKTLFRYKYYNGYKDGRFAKDGEVASPQQLELRVQFGLLEYILRDIGVPILKLDGYESDDFIYSVVNLYSGEDIFIKADDFDLIDTKLLNPKVSFISKSSIQSQPIGEMKRKIITGCTSDKIPALKHSNIDILNNLDLYYAKGIIEPNIGYIKEVTGLNGEPLMELCRNIFLVVPHILDLSYFDGFKPICINDINLDKLIIYLHVFGLKSSLKHFGINILRDDDEIRYITDMFNRYREQVYMYEYGSL